MDREGREESLGIYCLVYTGLLRTSCHHPLLHQNLSMDPCVDWVVASRGRLPTLATISVGNSNIDGDITCLKATGTGNVDVHS